MDQDKMKPKIALGTPFKVQGLIWYTYGSRMADRVRGRCMWAETKEEAVLLTWCTCLNVWAEIFAVVACAKHCIERYYIRAEIFICSARQLFRT
jgi:hypothetical protein